LGPSGTRLKNLGSSWETGGQHIPGADTARYSPPSASIGVGTAKFKAPAYGRTVLGLNAPKGADQVELEVKTKNSAWGLLHHEDRDHDLQDGDAFFCPRGECKCPDGHELQPLGDDSYLALFA